MNNNQPNNQSTRTPAFDTCPLSKENLTENQRDIIDEIDELLIKIKNSSYLHEINNRNDKGNIWANIEPSKGNNIILIEGRRGAGKTTFLLSLIKEWGKKSRNSDQLSNVSKDMVNVVRTLQPLDFDPIPPDLSIFSWIIQAFYPLVNHLNKGNFQMLKGPDVSIKKSFDKLHDAATIGWTTGLLAHNIGKDYDEFFMWQKEQQIEWQYLRVKWKQFIDKLLEQLEGIKQLPEGGIIVLPIDDLDMQVRRTRELLLALRMLYHPRLVYILTGEKENTDLALITSFYHEFTRNSPIFSDDGDINDQVKENSEILGKSLREKSIPASQIFKIDGISIKEAMDWEAPSLETKLNKGNSQKLGEVIRNLSGIIEGNSESNTLDKLLREFSYTIMLPFRKLQNFYDKWGYHKEKSNTGIVEFLSIALENPFEESLYVGSEQELGSIGFTGDPGLGTIYPKKVYTIKIEEENISINWAKHFGFIRSMEPIDTDIEKKYFTEASNEYLLAIELGYKFKELFDIDSRIRFIDSGLGIIWTEALNHVVPWPMLRQPKSPMEWVEEYNKWKAYHKQLEVKPDNLSSDQLITIWLGFQLNEEISFELPPQKNIAMLLEKLVKTKKSNLTDFSIFIYEHLGLSLELRNEFEKIFVNKEHLISWGKLAINTDRNSSNSIIEELSFLLRL